MADKNFTDEVTEATGISKEDIDAKLAKMDVDCMFDVLDALSHGEKDRVRKLMGGKKERIKENDDSVFSIGDKILYRGKKGIVKIPSGPEGSVGILINGELHMVNKHKLTNNINEGFLGVSDIPHSIVPGQTPSAPKDPAVLRMLQLAGLVSYADCDTCDDEDTPEALERGSRVFDALNDLETHIPKLRIKDVGQVREKLNHLMNLLSGCSD